MTIRFTHEGETLSLRRWAKRLGLKHTTVLARYRAGHRDASMLFAPVGVLTNRTHGHSLPGRRTPTYLSWQAMRQRCARHPSYVGRVTVCQRWLRFEAFLADMGPRPPGKTLDRYPNNAGNYEPGNCRWATPLEQAANTRQARRYLTFRGRTMTMSEWAREVGLRVGTLRERLAGGWTLRAALTRPVDTTARHTRRNP